MRTRKNVQEFLRQVPKIGKYRKKRKWIELGRSRCTEHHLEIERWHRRISCGVKHQQIDIGKKQIEKSQWKTRSSVGIYHRDIWESYQCLEKVGPKNSKALNHWHQHRSEHRCQALGTGIVRETGITDRTQLPWYIYRNISIYGLGPPSQD